MWGWGPAGLSFDPEYRTVFSNLLGRVAVMEDLDAAIAAARRYGYRFRIVTLDGQVLNPGGSMTGGSASRSAGILSRANELERLNVQSAGAAGASWSRPQRAAGGGGAGGKRRPPMNWRRAQSAAAGVGGRGAEGGGARWTTAAAWLADLREQPANQRQRAGAAEEPHRPRSSRTPRHARDRIRELEGTAAALKSEAEGKVRGQTRSCRTRSLTASPRSSSQLTAGAGRPGGGA
ncbi:MAG: hypothetical protein ACLR0P_05415 [Oscillospiraceae bacterium]